MSIMLHMYYICTYNHTFFYVYPAPYLGGSVCILHVMRHTQESNLACVYAFVCVCVCVRIYTLAKF